MSNDSKTTTGWIVFITALGLMCGSMGTEIMTLHQLSDMATPFFIGMTMVNLSAIIAAFVGGKIIPENRDNRFTRLSDTTVQKLSDLRAAGQAPPVCPKCGTPLK